MMMSPELYYEANIKDRSKSQLMSTIHSLKREINKLKASVESTGSKNITEENVKLHIAYEYLDEAQKALADILNE